MSTAPMSKQGQGGAMRTTAAVICDLLAKEPGERIHLQAVADRIERHRSGVDKAVAVLVKAQVIENVLDPTDRRRNVIYMTSEQAKKWEKDAGEAVADAANFNLFVPAVLTKAATASTTQAKERRCASLRFGVWSDGALAIEGLARKQLTLSAAETGNLASTLASLPEGALQALFESVLKPVFTLNVDGRDYPLTTEQTADLVAYIEQLPAKALRTPSAPGLKHGTDHRVHRLGDDDDTARQ